MSGGFGFGSSSSSSNQQSTSSQQIAPLQMPFLQSLFGQAQQLANSQLGPIRLQANQLSGNLLTSGQQFIQGLQGGASGLGAGVGDAISGLGGFGGAQQPGNQLINQAGAGAQQLLGPNPALQGQTQALSEALQANLQATAGTIGQQATLAGQTGGSRQALATGLAAQESQRQFGQGVSSLLSQDFAARQQLAPQLLGQQLAAGQALNQGALGQSGQQLQALQAAGGLGNQAAGLQTAAAGQGLGQLGGLFNLGLAPFGAELSPLMSLAQIIGRPTVLGQSQSTGSSDSEGFNFGFGG